MAAAEDCPSTPDEHQPVLRLQKPNQPDPGPRLVRLVDPAGISVYVRPDVVVLVEAVRASPASYPYQATTEASVVWLEGGRVVYAGTGPDQVYRLLAGSDT